MTVGYMIYIILYALSCFDFGIFDIIYDMHYYTYMIIYIIISLSLCDWSFKFKAPRHGPSHVGARLQQLRAEAQQLCDGVSGGPVRCAWPAAAHQEPRML